jgi:hypothetical protein
VAKLPLVSTTLAANLPLVSTTLGANFSTHFASVVDTGQRHRWQFATGINEVGGKFATGVNDIGGN